MRCILWNDLGLWTEALHVTDCYDAHETVRCTGCARSGFSGSAPYISSTSIPSIIGVRSNSLVFMRSIVATAIVQGNPATSVLAPESPRDKATVRWDAAELP